MHSPYKSWKCLICGFIYSEADGLPKEGIAPGTRWEDLPPAGPAQNAAPAKKISK
jgi:rubredoxin